MLRPALDREPRRPGVGRLKRILDPQTFSRASNVPTNVREVLIDAFRHLRDHRPLTSPR